MKGGFAALDLLSLLHAQKKKEAHTVGTGVGNCSQPLQGQALPPALQSNWFLPLVKPHCKPETIHKG